MKKTDSTTKARASRRAEPRCSATIGQIKACPVCAPILAYAHSLPPTELPRALEIMRLTRLLYAEIHKPNASTEARHSVASGGVWDQRQRAAGSSEPACSPPPHELACRMLNAIGWNGNDFRLRDPVALAIAPEVERINRRANAPVSGGTPSAEADCSVWCPREGYKRLACDPNHNCPTDCEHFTPNTPVSGGNPSAPVVCWTCRICGRTGFDKPTAHGCLNKPKDWKKSNRVIKPTSPNDRPSR